MDQGAIAESGGRTWTPLRAMLIALGAVAGGILLSVALGGPAHADTPESASQPASTSPGTSLVERVSGALSGVTGAVVSPVDHLVTQTVTTVLPAPAPATPTTTPASRPAPPAALAPVTTAVTALPAALDGALAQVPLTTTPLWQGLLGPHPVQSLTSPLAVTLRPVAPGVVDLLAPISAAPVATAIATPSVVEGALGPAAPAVGTTAGSPAPESSAGMSGVPGRPDVAPPAPAPAPGPAAPSGAVDGVLAGAPVASMTGAALLIAAFAILLLVATTARRRGWTLPAAPVFGADVSPD